MDIAPVWRSPHRFQRVALSRGGLVATEYVTTWGIACTEVVGHDLTSDRVLERVGLPWIASLTDGELARHLRDDLDVSDPGQPSTGDWLGGEKGCLAPSVLDAYESSEARSAREWLNHYAAHLVREIDLAADERRRPDSAKTSTTPPSDGEGQPFVSSLLDDARDLLERSPPPFVPYRLRSGAWAVPFRDLKERVALELFQLFELRPVLRRCIFCNAVYAPIGREANCSWRLFDTPAFAVGPTRTVLRQCVDDETWAQWHKAEEAKRTAKAYDRKRRALNETLRRRRLAYGNDHPATKRAEAERDAYVGRGLQRGPRPSVSSSGGDIASPTTEGASDG